MSNHQTLFETDYTLSLVYTVPTSVLRDLAITAIEGGIGYWSEMQVYEWRDDKGVEYDFPRATLQVIGEEGEPSGEEFILTPAVLMLGIQRLLQPGFQVATAHKLKAFELLIDPENVDYDVDDADVIVQAALLGEIVYG